MKAQRAGAPVWREGAPFVGKVVRFIITALKQQAGFNLKLHTQVHYLQSDKESDNLYCIEESQIFIGWPDPQILPPPAIPPQLPTIQPLCIMLYQMGQGARHTMYTARHAEGHCWVMVSTASCPQSQEPINAIYTWRNPRFQNDYDFMKVFGKCSKRTKTT